jgi:hypothetical protein
VERVISTAIAAIIYMGFTIPNAKRHITKYITILDKNRLRYCDSITSSRLYCPIFMLPYIVEKKKRISAYKPIIA